MGVEDVKEAPKLSSLTANESEFADVKSIAEGVSDNLENVDKHTFISTLEDAIAEGDIDKVWDAFVNLNLFLLQGRNRFVIEGPDGYIEDPADYARSKAERREYFIKKLNTDKKHYIKTLSAIMRGGWGGFRTEKIYIGDGGYSRLLFEYDNDKQKIAFKLSSVSPEPVQMRAKEIGLVIA